MSIIYKCRHCLQTVGTVEKEHVDEQALGLDELSQKEKQQMIEQDPNSGQMAVYAICDSCAQTLEDHPQYHELDYFIH